MRRLLCCANGFGQLARVRRFDGNRAADLAEDIVECIGEPETHAPIEVVSPIGAWFETRNQGCGRQGSSPQLSL